MNLRVTQPKENRDRFDMMRQLACNSSVGVEGAMQQVSMDQC